MASVFVFRSPVDFINAHIGDLPGAEKRGALRRMAQAAQVFPSYFSLIMKRERHLNLDQASKLATYFNFDTNETRFFFRITELEKAGSHALREILQKEIAELQEKNNQISKFVKNDKIELSLEDTQKFYSHWIYSAVRTSVDLPKISDSKTIAAKFGLPEASIRDILIFLLKTGLCKNDEGQIKMGPAHVHLESSSPMINSHHANWRMKAMQRHPFMNQDKELAYSLVTCLSKEDVIRVRKMLLEFIHQLKLVTDPSPSEALYGLNIDWLEI